MAPRPSIHPNKLEFLYLHFETYMHLPDLPPERQQFFRALLADYIRTFGYSLLYAPSPADTRVALLSAELRRLATALARIRQQTRTWFRHTLRCYNQ
ncbi:hypothetical protein C8R46DRAFT_1214014 [Mycena filopes]|nr:hypothetical protein C8R46DRAFT_1214014 [Mycena filopes]